MPNAPPLMPLNPRAPSIKPMMAKMMVLLIMPDARLCGFESRSARRAMPDQAQPGPQWEFALVQVASDENITNEADLARAGGADQS